MCVSLFKKCIRIQEIRYVLGWFPALTEEFVYYPLSVKYIQEKCLKW